jgi:hypothetical protein
MFGKNSKIELAAGLNWKIGWEIDWNGEVVCVVKGRFEMGRFGRYL